MAEWKKLPEGSIAWETFKRLVSQFGMNKGIEKAKKISRNQIEKYENIAKKFENECIIISPLFVELTDEGKIKKLRDIIRYKGLTIKI